MALQVNNCNEARKTGNLEIATLRNLKQEIISDSELINSYIAQYDQDKKYVVKLYSLFGEKPEIISRDSLNSLMMGSFLNLNIELNRNVYNEVVNSGRLSLIQNEELKAMLLEWGTVLDRARSREQWAEKFAREYVFPFTLDYLTWKDTDKLDPLMEPLSPSPSKLSVDNRVILESLRFENLIGNWIYNLEIMKETYQSVAERAEEITAEIDRELAGRQ